VGAAIEVWVRGDAQYPAALDDAPNPPARVFARGTRAVADRVAIAVVGARRATEAGLSAAWRIGRVLAQAGACVVSGLALGIDAAAHAGALDVENGRTCAILGGGIEAGVPASNGPLKTRIAARGLLLSEWEPHRPPAPWMFPYRNRLIAAMCRAVVVVEAGPKSGALHTAQVAIDLGRELAVVPGPIDRDWCLGSNRLLQREGVRAIVAVEDVLDLIGPRIDVVPPRPEFSGDESKVWDVLAGGAMAVDTIAIRSHLPTTRCLAAITTLEMAGAVICLLSGEVQRT
jgi:DNA processing protein